MPLLFPHSDVPFEPNPGFLLGVFDIYDREETLGVLLEKSDPNDPVQLRQLIERYILPRWGEANGFSEAHRQAILESVSLALAKRDYDFSALLTNERGDFYLPSAWNILDLRLFFERCYDELLPLWSSNVWR